MASLQKQGDRRVLQFTHPHRGRQTLRLGRIDKASAERVKHHVEQLVSSISLGTPLVAETHAWLGTLTDDFHSTLVRIGLALPREAPATINLDAFLESYIEFHSTRMPNTIRNYRQSLRHLTSFFGKDRDIRAITPGEAEDYREYLRKAGLAEATVSREIKRAKQFFASAADKRLIPENPFKRVKGGSQKNKGRQFFVYESLTASIWNACPDDEWRLLYALCRYQGLRNPSETFALRWEDVVWGPDGEEYLIIRSRKTKERIVPIFPEVKPLLQAASARAQGGNGFVIQRHGGTLKNISGEFKRILNQAGITPWPRLFHNLRSTRQTELVQVYEAHVVAAWLGNSEKIADDHYLQVIPDHIRKATQNPTHQFSALSGTERSPETRKDVSPAIAKDTSVQIPPRGVEPRFSY